MKKKFWNSEKLLSISAIIVSLSTLIVFFYQTNLIRKQQYVSVYPYLSLNHQYSGTLKYSYIISNDGIGPAFIESIKITDSGSKTFDSFGKYLSDLGITKDSIWCLYSDLSIGKLISAGEKIELVQIVNKETLEILGIDEPEGLSMNTTANAKQLTKTLKDDNLKIEIVYSSVYGEKWRLAKSKTPEKLD